MAKKEIEQTEIEAPYELPEGWKWCRLGDVAEIIMGQSPAGTSMTENQNDIAFIGGASDMGEELPNISRYTSEPTKLSKRDDVIVCIRATLGRPIFSDGIYCLGRGVAGIRSETLMKEYIKYGFLNFEQYLYDKATGSTFLQVSSKYLNEMPFPLPPTLDEQQRIVNRIESMFAKLDEAKEKAQNVVDGFETRKAAILHKAFTGELTAKWRKENGVSDDSWEEKRLGEAYFINPKIKAEDETLASFIPMEKIEPAGVNQFTFEVKTWGAIKKNHTQFQNGDVCFAKISPCFENGKAFIARNLENGIGAGTTELIILRSTEIDTHYTFYVVTDLSFVRKCCTTYSGTVGQQRINMDYVRNYKINLPTLPEQQEIVRILDSVLEKENKAKQAAEAVLEQIDLLKKSILARAFRGEL